MQFFTIEERDTEIAKLSLSDSYELSGNLAFLNKNFVSCKDYSAVTDLNLQICIESTLNNAVIFKIDSDTTKITF